MNDVLKKIKESNYNVIYQIYNHYNTNYLIEIIISFIEIFQTFSLIMSDLV